MGAGRVVGGVLALIGSVFLLIPLLISPSYGISVMIAAGGTTMILYLVVLIVDILAVIGAILALASKRGILALIMGIVLLILNLLPWIITGSAELTFLGILSSQTVWEVYLASTVGFSFYLTIWMTLETILILVGGIIATAAGE